MSKTSAPTSSANNNPRSQQCLTNERFSPAKTTAQNIFKIQVTPFHSTQLLCWNRALLVSGRQGSVRRTRQKTRTLEFPKTCPIITCKSVCHFVFFFFFFRSFKQRGKRCHVSLRETKASVEWAIIRSLLCQAVTKPFIKTQIRQIIVDELTSTVHSPTHLDLLETSSIRTQIFRILLRFSPGTMADTPPQWSVMICQRGGCQWIIFCHESNQKCYVIAKLDT